MSGKRIAYGTGVLALALVVAAGVASTNLLYEAWYFKRLTEVDPAADYEGANDFANKLVQVGTPRTLVKLFHLLNRKKKIDQVSDFRRGISCSIHNPMAQPPWAKVATPPDVDVNAILATISPEALLPFESVEQNGDLLIAKVRPEITAEIQRRCMWLRCIWDLTEKFGPTCLPALRTIAEDESLLKQIRAVARREISLIEEKSGDN